MCTVLLPLGDNPVAVNKYIISFIPDIDDKWMIRSFGGMMTDRGKTKFSEKPGLLLMFLSTSHGMI